MLKPLQLKGMYRELKKCTDFKNPKQLRKGDWLDISGLLKKNVL